MNSQKSISLSEALNKSNYSSEIKDQIKLFIGENIANYKDSLKVFLTFCFNKNIFVIKHTLNIEVKNKIYPIYLLIYIPTSFPEELRIYIQKISEFEINPLYKDENIIDFSTLELYYKNIMDFKPLENKIISLIEKIYNKFSFDFPLYKAQNVQEFFGPCFLDEQKSTLIDIKEDDIKNYKTLEELRKKMTQKILNLIDNKLFEIQTTSSELEAIEKDIDEQIANSFNKTENRDIIELEKIVGKLREMESKLKKEVYNLKYKDKKSILDQCHDIVRIKDEKKYKYTVMQKTIEDFLLYIKRGMEKKLIKFSDCVDRTRKLSKELFFIKYIIDQRNNE